MKFNLCAVALAAMAMGVSARPSVDKATHKSAVARQEGKGAVGTVFSRASLWGGSNSFPSFRVTRDDDDDKDEDEDDEDSSESSSSDSSDDNEDSSDSSDDSDDSDDSSDDSDDSDDSSSGSASAAVGDYTYPAASSTSVSYASATGSSSGSQTTGSGSSSGSSGSSGSLPASSGTSALDAVQTIAAGESFDGGYVMYDRGVSCTGQSEGGDSDAVFQIENGGTLKNVIIGPNQIEGVHCQGACTLENVWWSAVCEDAFTIKNQESSETTTITGGGAYGADDKVMQHNGAGSLSISDFVVEDFGKLYRSCGNCDSMSERHVTISGVTASNGDLLAGINSNYGDSATISDTTASGVEEICEQFEGNESGDEPTSVGTGNDGTYCIIDSSVTSS